MATSTSVQLQFTQHYLASNNPLNFTYISKPDSALCPCRYSSITDRREHFRSVI